ncbi:unnamed protein product [Strongylus vulgaris]|uniref:Uncharacterized protein n=1 Tax=Strongylus vulgaris TaxID=40348 RepID=A0A3P7JFY1_STRVU|nr:unnamed protein product [Strongylus vulgaris]
MRNTILFFGAKYIHRAVVAQELISEEEDHPKGDSIERGSNSFKGDALLNIDAKVLLASVDVVSLGAEVLIAGIDVGSVDKEVLLSSVDVVAFDVEVLHASVEVGSVAVLLANVVVGFVDAQVLLASAEVAQPMFK